MLKRSPLVRFSGYGYVIQLWNSEVVRLEKPFHLERRPRCSTEFSREFILSFSSGWFYVAVRRGRNFAFWQRYIRVERARRRYSRTKINDIADSEIGYREIVRFDGKMIY